MRQEQEPEVYGTQHKDNTMDRNKVALRYIGLNTDNTMDKSRVTLRWRLLNTYTYIAMKNRRVALRCIDSLTLTIPWTRAE